MPLKFTLINLIDILTHILLKEPDIDLPYFPYDESDESSYAEYPWCPRIQGFQMRHETDALILQVADDHSYAEFTGLLQSWLLFGFLQNICVENKKPFDLSKFVNFPIMVDPKMAVDSYFQSELRRTFQRSLPVDRMQANGE